MGDGALMLWNALVLCVVNFLRVDSNQGIDGSGLEEGGMRWGRNMFCGSSA